MRDLQDFDVKAKTTSPPVKFDMYGQKVCKERGEGREGGRGARGRGEGEGREEREGRERGEGEVEKTDTLIRYFIFVDLTSTLTSFPMVSGEHSSRPSPDLAILICIFIVDLKTGCLHDILQISG